MGALYWLKEFLIWEYQDLTWGRAIVLIVLGLELVVTIDLFINGVN
jgi:hypothetical protein